jgi:hypothetical protein
VKAAAISSMPTSSFVLTERLRRPRGFIFGRSRGDKYAVALASGKAPVSFLSDALLLRYIGMGKWFAVLIIIGMCLLLLMLFVATLP